MDAKLSLRAVTLRGIGSYLHGARLEIRPLTVLCGMNGAGKSTWFKALNMLKDSMREEHFPFRWSVNDWDASDIVLTNAFVHLEADMGAEENIKYPFLNGESLEREFGPPCTIGLEFTSTQDLLLPQHKSEEIDEETRQSFLWSGQCRIGSRFTVRLSHPTCASEPQDIPDVPSLYHLIELQLNGQTVIRFYTSNRLSHRYTLECSASFVPGFGGVPTDRSIQVAECANERDDVLPIAGVVSRDEANTIVKAAASRIRELLTEVLSSYFYVSAIRTPHMYKWIGDEGEPDFDKEAAIDARYVGSQGEASWWLERSFASIRMLPVADMQQQVAADKYPFFIEYVSKWLKSLLQTEIDYRNVPDSIWANSPIGYLTNERPPDNPDDLHEVDPLRCVEDLECLLHPSFSDEPQSPKQMSSGFHQILPLVVQSALMRQYEIMAVENPEVHLHPRLQLQVAEFLLHQAKSGKWIIIETHSDLIIRRIIREILEEDIAIGQEKIGLYFASLDEVENAVRLTGYRRYRYSTLERIQIDEETGRIANWPTGFLDEDVREARRLLNIMYGGPPDVTEVDE